MCVKVTEEFLKYSLERGNDLMTPVLEYGFQGLKPGDKWCLCAARWSEAKQAGAAPGVILEATSEKALNTIGLLDFQTVNAQTDTTQSSHTRQNKP